MCQRKEGRGRPACSEAILQKGSGPRSSFPRPAFRGVCVPVVLMPPAMARWDWRCPPERVCVCVCAAARFPPPSSPPAAAPSLTRLDARAQADHLQDVRLGRGGGRPEQAFGQQLRVAILLLLLVGLFFASPGRALAPLLHLHRHLQGADASSPSMGRGGVGLQGRDPRRLDASPGCHAPTEPRWCLPGHCGLAAFKARGGAGGRMDGPRRRRRFRPNKLRIARPPGPGGDKGARLPASPGLVLGRKPCLAQPSRPPRGSPHRLSLSPRGRDGPGRSLPGQTPLRALNA